MGKGGDVACFVSTLNMLGWPTGLYGALGIVANAETGVAALLY